MSESPAFWKSPLLARNQDGICFPGSVEGSNFCHPTCTLYILPRTSRYCRLNSTTKEQPTVTRKIPLHELRNKMTNSSLVAFPTYFIEHDERATPVPYKTIGPNKTEESENIYSYSPSFSLQYPFWHETCLLTDLLCSRDPHIGLGVIRVVTTLSQFGEVRGWL